MGEIAEMMLDGTLCQQCGGFIGVDNGYPTTCEDCQRDEMNIPQLIKEIERLCKNINKKNRYVLFTNYWRFNCLDIFYYKNGNKTEKQHRKLIAKIQYAKGDKQRIKDTLINAIDNLEIIKEQKC